MLRPFINVGSQQVVQDRCGGYPPVFYQGTLKKIMTSFAVGLPYYGPCSAWCHSQNMKALRKYDKTGFRMFCDRLEVTATFEELREIAETSTPILEQKSMLILNGEWVDEHFSILAVQVFQKIPTGRFNRFKWILKQDISLESLPNLNTYGSPISYRKPDFTGTLNHQGFLPVTPPEAAGYSIIWKPQNTTLRSNTNLWFETILPTRKFKA